MRVVIPEASLWEPQSPFLYEGPVELWQDGVRCDWAVVRHGFRAISLGPRGLRLNGKPLELHGREMDSPPDANRARELRLEGTNLLLASVVPGVEALWDAADRFGFFVLGKITDGSEETIRRAAVLARYPSTIGWVLQVGANFLGRLPPSGLVGVEAPEASWESLPNEAHFVLTPRQAAQGWSVLGRGAANAGIELGSVWN
jgi:hypothetical protein